MNYSISDFKTGQNISTPAKMALWDNIIRRTFGGIECALTQYEKYTATGSWRSYKINGMITYLDELTGGDYGRCHPQITRTAGTLASQFKVKFPSIHYLFSNSTNSILDQEFNIYPTKEKNHNKVSVIKKPVLVDHSKVYSVLADVYSKNLSVEEIEFIGNKLLNP